MPYEPYQQRVVEEREQLDERISKLEAFIEGLDASLAKDVDLLRCQLYAMRSYHAILSERISRWEA